MSRFNLNTHTFSNFYADDGLQGNEFSKNASFADHNGILWFGGTNGITYFNPQEITNPAKKWNVRIIDFYLHDQPIRKGMLSGGKEIINTSVFEARDFHLSHNDNAFSIEFSTRELNNSERITYLYTINNTPWVKLPKGVNRVSFSDLPPGDYHFRIKAEDYLLEMLDEHTTEEAKNSANSLDFYDIGIAEIVLMPSSNLINQTIKGAGFRDKFNVNVLGIRRKKEYLLQDLGNERIHSGDVLLVQGTWNNIARLSKEDADWVVLGQPLAEAAKVTLDYKAPVAAVIMVLMVAMMVFDFIPVAPVTAVMIAGILMVLTGCFRNVEAAYKTINWESIVLIAAMLPMSLALEKTGASEYISNSLVSELGTYGPLALMAGIYFTTSLMTMFISNTATAVLLAPIAMQSATQIGVSPVPFLFAVTLGASMCFASPFSTPPNALVMPAGQYTFMDYVKVGLPLQIIMGIVMVLVLPLLFPF